MGHGRDALLANDFVTELGLVTNFALFNMFRDASIEHLQRVRHADRRRLLFQTGHSLTTLTFQ